MLYKRSSRRNGFTLVELAIVLAVAGLLFTGLWRLLATGNKQLQDSSASSQQAQLIASVKNFLASDGGQTFMKNQHVPNPGQNPFPLPLPTNSQAGQPGCPTDPSIAILGGNGPAEWCAALPSGFSASTTNSYGQTYEIQVRVESNSGSGTVPTAYSFMIITTAGTVIPDTSGGRISSQIGGDGGFIYSTLTCGTAATEACGAYGAWAADPTVSTYGYGFTNSSSGHVASRTYVSPDQTAGAPWLARQLISGDNTYGFNTMSTNLYMGAAATPNNIQLNANGSYQGNSNGTANNVLYGTKPLSVDPKAPGSQFGGRIDQLNQLFVGMNFGDTNSALIVSDNNGCLANSFNAVTGALSNGANTCYAALQVSGNQTTTGMVEANVLWASSFIYGQTQPSDMRVKKDVMPLHSALSDVMKLKPVTFRFKQDSRQDIGFIAQELKTIYPQLVVDRPDGIMGVNYMGLLAPLVRSVQELEKQNDELRDQLKEQQSEIDRLNSKAN